MGTKHQLGFVEDIEAGCKHLISENITTVTKINQVMEAAGRNLSEFTPMIWRLKASNQWDLLNRIADAFISVKMVPVCVTRALESRTKEIMAAQESGLDPETPFNLEPELPPEPIKPTVKEQRTPLMETIKKEPSKADLVVQVYNILATKDKKTRQEVLTSTSILLEVD